MSSDPKLAFLVKRCVKSGVTDAEDICRQICDEHMEYRRKPQGPLRKAIAAIARAETQQLQNDGQQTGNGDQNGTAATPAGGANLMNQMLSEQYNKAQTEGLPGSEEEPPTTRRKRRKPASRSEMSDDENGPEQTGVMPTTADMFLTPRPPQRFSDLGGVSKVIDDITQMVRYPLVFPQVYSHLGVEPPKGILLHGPPGCGKTLLANAIAGELGIFYYKVSAPELVSGTSGDSEARIRTLFESAVENAPSLVFIDEIDVIAPKRDSSQRGMDKRIVAQLLASMDSLSSQAHKSVIVLGATNRADSIDAGLRRAGRFDREICLGVPDQAARAEILRTMVSKMKLEGEFDLELLAKKTPGYVGADLLALTKEAAVVAIDRIFKSLHHNGVPVHELLKSRGLPTGETAMMLEDGASDHIGIGAEAKASPEFDPLAVHEQLMAFAAGLDLDSMVITMQDFLTALPKVQPSAKREGFATVPDVTWADIGALDEVREELSLAILEAIAYPETFRKLGLNVSAGVLLYGPPGCGKTLLAKAVANQSGANFISVKGPELLDKYVGESEKAVRQVFQRAGASQPCVVFFDELDALVPKRGGESSSGVSERVVNQLLTELDGLESRREVFIIAATNRPELIDSAMLRPGRLDKLVYVPLPSPQDRVSILRAVTRKVALASDVDVEKVGLDPRCDGYSGADLSALVREAGLCVMRRHRQRLAASIHDARADAPPQKLKQIDDADLCIHQEHFEEALSRVRPSVSLDDRVSYENLRKQLASQLKV